MHNFKLAIFVAVFGLLGCGQSDEARISTECTTGLDLLDANDVPSTIVTASQGNYLYFRTAKLDGVCLDAMTQHLDRYATFTVRGEAAVASSGALSKVVFPGDRSLSIPNLKDDSCSVMSDSGAETKKVTSFSCRRFEYAHGSLSGAVAAPTSRVGGSTWALPWSNIDVTQSQYMYVIVVMPTGYSANQVPSTMDITFSTFKFR